MKYLFPYQSLPTKDTEKPKLGRIKGKDGQTLTLKLYPVSVLAKNLNRTSYTIRRWEAFGWIPKASFRIKKIRYYTESQIQLLMYLTIKHNLRHYDGVGRPTPQAFIDEAHEMWQELHKFTVAGMVTKDMIMEGQNAKTS
jgi:hypothetical protein